MQFFDNTDKIEKLLGLSTKKKSQIVKISMK